jgi:hypothetical protein
LFPRDQRRQLEGLGDRHPADPSCGYLGEDEVVVFERPPKDRSRVACEVAAAPLRGRDGAVDSSSRSRFVSESRFRVEARLWNGIRSALPRYWRPEADGKGLWHRGPRRKTHRVERKGAEMAYGIVHRFSGGTKEQYEASIAAVHPNGGRDLPDGQIFHAAGPSSDGWTIVAIHDSRESWERFRDNTLMPQLQAGIEGGFPSPPQETTFEVENHQTV